MKKLSLIVLCAMVGLLAAGCHTGMNSIENAEKAGVADFVSFGVSELRDLRNPFDGAPAVMVTNPPYGERLGNVKDLLTVYLFNC